MKRKFLSIILAVILLMSGSSIGIIIPVSAATEANDSEKIYCNATIDDDFAPDSVLVVLNTLTSLKCQTYSEADFSEIKASDVNHITAYSESVVQKALKNAETAAAFRSTIVEVEPVDLSTYRQVLYIELENPGKDKVLEAIKELEKREDVWYVGPDYYLEPCSDTSTQTYEEYFKDQWAYNTIELEKAWDKIVTSSEVLVGILDSGIDGNHDDLQGRINEELSTDLAYIYGTEDTDYDPLQDDDDMLNHGTKVAGIIAGVCENVQLVSLKIMSGHRATGGNGNAKYKSSYACRAIEHAKANNIMILNMSVGWEGASINGDFEHEYDYYNVPMASVLDQYDGLLICAAGNNNRNIDDNDADWDIYPQQYNFDNLLIVSASTQNDTIETNSNWGATSVDIFAPGESINTTIKETANVRRGTMSDTSAAAPMVAGVAAILLSVDPTLSDNMILVKEYIMDYADDSSDGVTAFVGKCESGGRLNAYKAVSAVLPTSCSHSSIYYTSTGLTHTIHCNNCNYTASEPHDNRYLTVSPERHVYVCRDCGYGIYESHTPQYTVYSDEEHKVRCSDCGYTTFADHDFYMYENNGEDGCILKCYDCSYTLECAETAEYEIVGSLGHYTICPYGCFELFEEHRLLGTEDYNNYTHIVECRYCGYTESAEHELYMYEDNGEDGCTVNCRDCDYSLYCPEAPEFDGRGASGHYASCPSGCFSFFEDHAYEYTSQNSQYHYATCIHCMYYVPEILHEWVDVGNNLTCIDCGWAIYYSSPNGIGDLTDEELAILVTFLPEEKLEMLIASLPENDLARVTALLPSDDEL